MNAEVMRCGFTVIAPDGTEEPCDRPAPSWRWYQGHDHEDALDVACELHENEGGRRLVALQDKVNELLAKVEAMGAPFGRHPKSVEVVGRLRLRHQAHCGFPNSECICPSTVEAR